MSSYSDQLSDEQYAEWARRTGFSELCDVLYWRWDPLGVADDFPATSGEYDSYARTLLSMLREGADAAGVAAHLLKLEHEWMGLDSPFNRDGHGVDAVADLIISWHEESIGCWLA